MKAYKGKWFEKTGNFIMDIKLYARGNLRDYLHGKNEVDGINMRVLVRSALRQLVLTILFLKNSYETSCTSAFS